MNVYIFVAGTSESCTRWVSNINHAKVQNKHLSPSLLRIEVHRNLLQCYQRGSGVSGVAPSISPILWSRLKAATVGCTFTDILSSGSIILNWLPPATSAGSYLSFWVNGLYVAVNITYLLNISGYGITLAYWCYLLSLCLWQAHRATSMAGVEFSCSTLFLHCISRVVATKPLQRSSGLNIYEVDKGNRFAKAPSLPPIVFLSCWFLLKRKLLVKCSFKQYVLTQMTNDRWEMGWEWSNSFHRVTI